METLQSTLLTKSAELSQLTAKPVKPTYEVGRLGLHGAAEDGVSEILKSMLEACGRPAKYTKVARRCEGSSDTPSTAQLTAFLAVWDEFKSRCGAITIKNQCIPGSAVEAKKLCKKMVKSGMTYVAAKDTHSSYEKKRAAVVIGGFACGGTRTSKNIACVAGSCCVIVQGEL